MFYHFSSSVSELIFAQTFQLHILVDADRKWKITILLTDNYNIKKIILSFYRIHPVQCQLSYVWEENRERLGLYSHQQYDCRMQYTNCWSIPIALLFIIFSTVLYGSNVIAIIAIIFQFFYWIQSERERKRSQIMSATQLDCEQVLYLSQFCWMLFAQYRLHYTHNIEVVNVFLFFLQIALNEHCFVEVTAWIYYVTNIFFLCFAQFVLFFTIFVMWQIFVSHSRVWKAFCTGL